MLSRRFMGDLHVIDIFMIHTIYMYTIAGSSSATPSRKQPAIGNFTDWLESVFHHSPVCPELCQTTC